MQLQINTEAICKFMSKWHFHFSYLSHKEITYRILCETLIDRQTDILQSKVTLSAFYINTVYNLNHTVGL